jgi:hypothetical protein
VVSRLSFLKEVFRTWRARLLAGGAIFIALYQFACDQFGFPTLPNLWHMTGLPWWAWLFFAQTGVLYGLFDYVRHFEREPAPAEAKPAAPSRKPTNFELGRTIESAVSMARMSTSRNPTAREIEKAFFPIRALMLTLTKEMGIVWPPQTADPLVTLESALRIMEQIAPLIQAGHVDEARRLSTELAERLTPKDEEASA